MRTGSFITLLLCVGAATTLLSAHYTEGVHLGRCSLSKEPSPNTGFYLDAYSVFCLTRCCLSKTTIVILICWQEPQGRGFRIPFASSLLELYPVVDVVALQPARARA